MVINPDILKSMFSLQYWLLLSGRIVAITFKDNIDSRCVPYLYGISNTEILLTYLQLKLGTHLQVISEYRIGDYSCE